MQPCSRELCGDEGSSTNRNRQKEARQNENGGHVCSRTFGRSGFRPADIQGRGEDPCLVRNRRPDGFVFNKGAAKLQLQHIIKLVNHIIKLLNHHLAWPSTPLHHQAPKPLQQSRLTQQTIATHHQAANPPLEWFQNRTTNSTKPCQGRRQKEWSSLCKHGWSWGRMLDAPRFGAGAGNNKDW